MVSDRGLPPHNLHFQKALVKLILSSNWHVTLWLTIFEIFAVKWPKFRIWGSLEGTAPKREDTSGNIRTFCCSRASSKLILKCSVYKLLYWPSKMTKELVSYYDSARIWNSLPQHVTSAPSLAIFCSRLKTHLFRRSFPWLHCSLVVPEKWHVITDTLIVFITYLLTYLLTYWAIFAHFCDNLYINHSYTKMHN